MRWLRITGIDDALKVGAVLVTIIGAWYAMSNQLRATADGLVDVKADVIAERKLRAEEVGKLKDRDELLNGQMRDVRETTNVRLSVIEAMLLRIERKIDQK